ncbi:hypothetical protein ACFV23_31260 [Streptomyces sp. NPDC059627]
MLARALDGGVEDRQQQTAVELVERARAVGLAVRTSDVADGPRQAGEPAEQETADARQENDDFDTRVNAAVADHLAWTRADPGRPDVIALAAATYPDGPGLLIGTDPATTRQRRRQTLDILDTAARLRAAHDSGRRAAELPPLLAHVVHSVLQQESRWSGALPGDALVGAVRDALGEDWRHRPDHEVGAEIAHRIAAVLAPITQPHPGMPNRTVLLGHTRRLVGEISEEQLRDALASLHPADWALGEEALADRLAVEVPAMGQP